MIRVLFEVCGEMDCTSFTMTSDFENTGVIRNDEALGLMCPDTINFISDPIIDEACIVCGTEPQIIDRNICKNSDGSLSISFSACGGTAPYMYDICLLYTSPSPRDATLSRMPSSA